MAQDLKLEIVIQALLDAKGFEDAKANLEGLTGTANKAGAALPKAADGAKKMGESFGGTRGPIADVTRVLLLNTGVTGAAGEAAKAAGIGMYFLEGAASAANVAIAGGVAALALLLPKIIEWMSSTKNLGEVTRGLTSDLDDNAEKVDKLAVSMQTANTAATNLLVALHAQAMDAERQKMARMAEEVETYTKNMAKLGQVVSDSPHIVALQQQVQLMQEAHAKGLTYAETLEKIAASGKPAAVSVTDLNDAIKRQMDAQAEGRRFAKQQEMDALNDMRSFTAKQDKIKAKAAADETERILAYGKLKKAESDADAEAARQKKIEAATVAEMYTNAITIGITALTKNKAINIAAAIADTWAGANKALAQGGIYGIPMAAVIIAQGLANVQHIRETKVGFDDPFADLTARKLGRQSAVDFVANFGAGFHSGMGGMQGGGGNSYHTTINRGTSVGNITMPGFVGAGKTEFFKHFRRALIKAERLEGRTTLGT